MWKELLNIFLLFYKLVWFIFEKISNLSFSYYLIANILLTYKLYTHTHMLCTCMCVYVHVCVRACVCRCMCVWCMCVWCMWLNCLMKESEQHYKQSCRLEKLTGRSLSSKYHPPPGLEIVVKNGFTGINFVNDYKSENIYIQVCFFKILKRLNASEYPEDPEEMFSTTLYAQYDIHRLRFPSVS